MKRTFILSMSFILAAIGAACGPSAANNANSAANANAGSAAPNTTVTAMSRPDKIAEMMKARGEQDSAKPILKILEPKENSVVNGSDVELKLELSGDLKGYMPGMDEATHTGNHIHVILDNEPYEAYYDITKPFVLKNVPDGQHTIRVFPSRPWHESYKNEGAFQMVTFTVKNGGADASKPTTTADGNTMANAAASPEAKAANAAGKVDPKKPLLTYSRPKGEYKGADAENIMLDFWITNTDLTPSGRVVGTDPCPCHVKYWVDGTDMGQLNRWDPIWLNGFAPGKHTIKLELQDRNGKLIENGGFNSTTREITVTK
ncbi:MAG: hypothetical protein UZ17_ACD001002759 [Acidobacteria bacterium OLB17]|nr:MAG: hypothetical protein UZ17_ACD001002759 [Acidobacteria bacterium OLB17]MCZ2390431.1 hypothetical protein [Acidobacteriota bacterium]